MYVLWWTGKGFYTPLIVFAALTLAGFTLQASRPLLSDTPWLWGIALLGAGAANWFVGRRENARRLAKVGGTSIRSRLFYRARHKFMSLPFEIWSFPLVVGGLVLIVFGVFKG